MARFASLLLVVAALPFVFANSESSCNSNEFLYEDKSCCVPYGGTPSPPSPPQGTQCPTSGWEWHEGKQCCVPHQPPANMPPPQCNSGWEWNGGSSTCCPFSSPSQPAFPPKPSGKSGSGFHWPRDKKSRAAPLCPNSLMACPLPGLSGVVGDYECVDTYADLESCGGCASTGAGQDCTAIEGVWNVGCNQGRCAIYTCAQGYKQSADGQLCIKL
ncbi:hypothetical protein AcV5_004505 [Taiwanofungus camphoratus]|nr:hypothetical protein AcW2_000899 [Antrodia cinnamomea]KAI0936340.1 hypothetical protein AcV5_004505 [Antrodia cinnamomea]